MRKALLIIGAAALSSAAAVAVVVIRQQQMFDAYEYPSFDRTDRADSETSEVQRATSEAHPVTSVRISPYES